MRTKTPALTRKSRSPTPDRSSRSQFFGTSPPCPSRTYGRKNQNRSRQNTPSHRHAMLPRSASPPIASSSRFPIYDLTLDYEEPIVLPATPSHSPPSTPPSGSTSNAGTITGPNSSFASKVADTALVKSSDDDDEPVFILMMPSGIPKPSTEVKLNDHEAVRRANTDLENSLRNAHDRIKALEAAANAHNECPCCLEVMFQPFILLCGHTFCKDCLLRLSDVYLKGKMNFACPDCRTLQGRFTPIPNYVSQHSVDQMLGSKGIKPPSRLPLQWPLRFRSGPVSLPFPRRNGTYPVSTPTFAPAPFPVSIDVDDD
ncbi:hypothetical protein F5051DRAFT_447128 [Lentinula edodes]|nr:hypothetical protein F5051DRAFT_447128 [Lentinula edodes]